MSPSSLMSTFATSGFPYLGGCFSNVWPGPFNGSGPTGGTPEMTFEICYSTCAGIGHHYFGVSSSGSTPGLLGDQCECSDVIGDPVVTTSCTQPCGGDSTEMCGGANEISVYEIIGEVMSVPGWNIIGCYSDNAYPNTTLTGNDTTGPDMTPQSCADFCSGFQYFGVEDGNSCYCGDAISNGGSLDYDALCDWACAGDPGAQCGAASFMNLYSNSAYTASSTTAPSVSTTEAVTRTTTMEASVTASPKNTAPYIPGFTSAIDVNGIWYGFYGCYSVSNETFATHDNSANMTVQSCLSFCAGSNYAVIEGRGCYCSNDLTANGASITQHSDSNCEVSCPGNPLEACGSSPISQKRALPISNLNNAAIYQVVADPAVASTTSSLTSMPAMTSTRSDNGGGALITSTVYDTEIITITSCASIVSNCPARTYKTSTPSAIVVYSEQIVTVFACASTVVDCPYRSGAATHSTNLVPLTTVSWAPYMTVPWTGIIPAGGNALPSTWPTYQGTSPSVVSAAAHSSTSLAWGSMILISGLALVVLWF